MGGSTVPNKVNIFFILIVILLTIIASELYILSVVQNTKPIQTSSQSKVRITPILDPVMKKKNLQNLFISDIQAYIQNPAKEKKKLITVLKYAGSVKEIKFINSNRVNLTIQDGDKKVLQSFIDWDTTKFVVYKSEKNTLIQIQLSQLKKDDLIQIQEFEEVIKDSMVVSETKNLLNYVEIIILPL